MKLSPSGRIFLAFWIFGLVNNVIYVVNLSAAIDVVGVQTPKSTVLLADVAPSFLVKLAGPFFVHIIPYHVRIALLVVLSALGMLIVALSAPVGAKLFGIVVASVSSGLGELSFLQLTHFYGSTAISGFSSGTGGAGLVGSFCYLAFTTWIGLSVKASLLVFSVVPAAFLLSFYYILPAPPASLAAPASELQGYHKINDEDDEDDRPTDSLLTGTEQQPTPAPARAPHRLPSAQKPRIDPFAVTLARLAPLVFPYMVPLFLVYVAEYIINQGISPTLLFPIEEMPFTRYRDAYVTYGTLYQRKSIDLPTLSLLTLLVGVFISRSSGSIFRIHRLYIPSLLQCLNLVIFIYQSLYVILPNVYIIMVLVFYEGLLGGAAYVNTFMKVAEDMPASNREFAMGAVGLSDSAGVVCAALISLFLEKALCHYQQQTGRPYCQLP